MDNRIFRLFKDPNRLKHRLLSEAVNLYLKRSDYNAPYSLDLYRNILTSSKQSGFFFEGFANRETIRDRVMYIRHDIDMPSCVENAASLFDIDIEFGILPGVYIRVDGRDYDPATAREFVHHYHRKGFEFGLHTCCYIEDDPFSALLSENEKFSDLYGFRPKSYNFHGLGSYRLKQRTALGMKLEENLSTGGYVFTDNTYQSRAYDYVIQDCHYSKKDKKRYFKNDVEEQFLLSKLFKRSLFLSHPCYWRS